MNPNDPNAAPAMVRVTVFHPIPEIVTQWARENCAKRFHFIPSSNDSGNGPPARVRFDRSKLYTAGRAFDFQFRLTIDFEGEADAILFRLRWSS